MELSKMFGVERDTDFMIDGYPFRLQINLYTNADGQSLERLVYLDKYGCACSVETGLVYAAIHAAPSGIIHLPPPLTDEQREQLRAIWTLGGRWLAKDCDGVVNYYTKIPYKESGYWFDNDDAERYGYAIPLSAGVCELQELNDVDEPFDIGKSLGVEG